MLTVIRGLQQNENVAAFAPKGLRLKAQKGCRFGYPGKESNRNPTTTSLLSFAKKRKQQSA
jgi:hypothetical protein